MIEITANIHNHTNISDGSGTFYEIAQAGLDAGIDVIITTDHNIYVSDQDKYYYRAGKSLLLLCGEEVHSPQNHLNNHMLILGVENEMSSLGNNMQAAINFADNQGGISIIAHPFDKQLSYMHLPSYAWNNWSIRNFSGLEIFNLLSQYKERSESITNLIRNTFSPDSYPLGPTDEAVQKWDELLCQNLHINGYAGSDSHQLYKHILGLKLNLFPYLFHFLTLNNHLYLYEAFNGEIIHDKQLVYDALRIGRSYIGMDNVLSTKGFEFFADSENGLTWPGETVIIKNSVTFQIIIPTSTLCRMIHNGKVIKQWDKVQSCPLTVFETGYYRVECYLPYRHELRGWIYSNPIYVLKG